MNRLIRRWMLAGVGATVVAAMAGPAAATNVCGPVNSNTTWTVVNNPYVITCDVVVMGGATLTINPGVIVQFQPGVKLKAQNGLISAIGTGGSHVSFTSISDPPGQGVELDFPNGGNGVFTFCDFSNLVTGIQNNCCNNSGPPGAINDCTFTGCTFGMSAYHGAIHGQVNNCTFANNVYGLNYLAYRDFTGCVFQNSGTTGADVGGQCNFTQCTFLGNPLGITSQTGQNCNVDRCGVVNNVIGIRGCDIIRRCSIYNNVKGIQVNGVPLIECCDIYSNTTYNAEMLGATTVNAPNNWWGTTNATAIAASIRDGFDQTGLGFLQYAPNLPGFEATTSTCACTAPNITSTPAGFSKYVGQTATFTITATATGTPSYQWKRNSVNLTNNGHFSGVNTNVLTINGVYDPGTGPDWTDAGSYTCEVTNLCGVATAGPINFTVQVCGADFNHSGIVSIQDLFDFLAAYFAGCP